MQQADLAHDRIIFPSGRHRDCRNRVRGRLGAGLVGVKTEGLLKLTAKELTRILNQPGYEILAGSQFDLVTTQDDPGQPQNDLPGQPIQNNRKNVLGASTASWRSEREFQRAVVDAYAAWAAINQEPAILCHVANENAHKQPGIVAGMPDLMLISAKGLAFVELKVGSGKLSEAQREMHYRLRRLGYRVVTVWDSVETVLDEIEKFLKGE